ncbi:nucleotidyltransferase family protein [Rhodovulum steppense]|uniref:nucleotidyltransferase family protein n=1 Tax=Rhodovulum steppense TaxID=540251 RepID=UPI0014049DD9|nr:nucleotidyltransferase family protein [Rhodovulum steppense]
MERLLQRIPDERADVIVGLDSRIRDILAIAAARLLPVADRLPAAWPDRLRAALAMEQARAAAFGRIVGQVLGDARVASLSPIVIGGAAIAAGHYPVAFLRHTAQLTLLMPDVDGCERARPVLTALGCQLESETPSRSRRVYRHPTGMPVVLFADRACTRMRDFRHADVLSRARPARMAGCPCQIPAPHDLWTELCYRAIVSGPTVSPQWLLDAVCLLASGDVEAADEAAFRQDTRMRLPYGALARALEAMLPQGALSPGRTEPDAR